MKGRFVVAVIAMLCVFLVCLFYVDSVCAYETTEYDFVGPSVYISEMDCINLVFQHIEDAFPEIEYVDEDEYIDDYEEEEIILDSMPYTEEDYELLAHLIFSEAGSDWCSDKLQLYTGSVVLNRVISKYYPNNIHDVIYQPGQYSVVKSGAINKIPNQRAYDCARFLLENGSVLPSNVIFQSQHIQGDGIYEKVQNTYFCYKN